jgi:hypothetical protein
MEPVWITARDVQPGQGGVDMGDAARERVRVCSSVAGAHSGCEDGPVAPDP